MESQKVDMRIYMADLLLLLADSIGLGVFTANGAAICIAFGCGDRIFLTLVCAVLTGVGGGILRDLCCMERPCPTGSAALRLAMSSGPRTRKG